MDAFPRVAAFVEAACAAAGLERADCLRVTLAVEELFTNTVTHGHGGDSDAPVTLTAETAPGLLRLAYEDTAPPFDPLAAVPSPDGRTDPAARPVGGLGVLLVTRLARDVAYARAGDCNRITLVVGGDA